MIIGHSPCSDGQMLTFFSLGWSNPTLVPASGGMPLAVPFRQAAFCPLSRASGRAGICVQTGITRAEKMERVREISSDLFFLFFCHTLNRISNTVLVPIQKGRPCTSVKSPLALGKSMGRGQPASASLPSLPCQKERFGGPTNCTEFPLPHSAEMPEGEVPELSQAGVYKGPPAAFGSARLPSSWQQPSEGHWCCSLLTCLAAHNAGHGGGGIWRGDIFLGAALKSASMGEGQLCIVSICHPNHRLISGGRATARSSHVRLSLEPNNIIFSDFKLSCNEYLIYRFSVWRKAARLHSCYSANFSLSNSPRFGSGTGTKREDMSMSSVMNAAYVNAWQRCRGNPSRSEVRLSLAWIQILYGVRTSPSRGKCSAAQCRCQRQRQRVTKQWVPLTRSDFPCSHHPSALIHQMNFPQAGLSPSFWLFPVTNHDFIRFWFCFKRPSWSLYLMHLFRKCLWGQWAY